MNENTPAGQNIAGAGQRATDANGDTLTYSFLTTGGTDYQHFAIDSASGQVKTHGALDHEARSSYSVTVRATDPEGAAGAIAYTIEVTDQDEPPAAPGAPAVSATAGTDTSLDVSWTAPPNAGKPAIDSYDLRYRKGNTGSWTESPSGVGSTSVSIPNLDANGSYQVQVRATNHEGDSDWSLPGTGRTGNSAPGAPTNLRTTPGNGRVTLRWTAPSSTGGAAITRYEYELDQSGTWTTTGGTATSYTVGNLNNEQSYTFRVRAVNSAGESSPSAPRSATPTGLGKIVIGFRGVSVPEGVVGQLSFPEDVGTAVLTAYLDRSPETALSVPWFSSDHTAVSPDDYTGGEGTLTFAPGETEQTISIPIVDDAIREDPDPVFGEDESFLVGLEFGDDYRLKNSGLVMVLILDNDGDRPVTPDPPGVTVSPSALTVAEGTTVTYTVRLDSEPTGNVTLTPSSDNPDVTFSPAILTFTTSNWNTAQTVTVTAAQDSDTAEDQATISHAVAGEDYGSVPAASVSVTVTDTDTDDDTDGGGGGESTSPPVTEDRIYYLPHLAVGEGWQTTITYINYSSHEVNCQTNFLSDQGTPLRVSFAELGTVAGRTDVVPPGGSVHQESNLELSAPLARGWARVTCSGPVKASLLYRRRNREGMPTAEAGVNATTVPATRFVTFAEQGEGRLGTGVAYANPSATAALVTFTARDADGEVLASDDLMLSPNGHGAQNMAPLFGLSSFTGSLEVTSTAPIVSLSLNFEADPVFSSLPPGELDAAAQGSTTYYLPHLAVGASWQTTITYINYSSQEVSCQTEFLSDHGSPLMVSFAELGTVVSRTDVLPPGGSVHQETNVELSNPLAPGWARVTCSGPLKASLLYRRRNSEGVPTGEAGVNATTVPANRFFTFAEQGEGQYGSGVAYANPSDTAALITFTARDADGRMLASVDRTLLPNGHDALNMAPLFGLSSFAGSLEVTSTEPIVSLSLNFEADPVFSSLPPGELDDAAQ